MKPTDLAFPCGQWAGPCELREIVQKEQTTEKKKKKKTGKLTSYGRIMFLE